ncbi:MAG: NAD(P)/FAD-dependent oxidoreductase [Cyanobacteria bacterium P01_A01_bin.3]
MAIKGTTKHRVAIIGGGFGGLNAARVLGDAPVEITLIDKRNFHLFQPLLYQVATGNVSPADISAPLRSVLSKNPNTTVLLDEAVGLDPDNQHIELREGTVSYDTLIIATGSSHHYFGNDQWSEMAPGLKTVEDALNIRRQVFEAFEAAEKEVDEQKRRQLLTFVIVGAGPTGVELAGAIAELAYVTMKSDFRNIDTSETQIVLLEGADRVLPPFSGQSSREAADALQRLGVTIRTQSLVTNIEDKVLTVKSGDEVEKIHAGTILWAAGVKASGLGKVLAEKTGAELDRAGRVMVQDDLSLVNYSNIHIVGDLAHVMQGDRPLPGVAPVAMQEGEYVAGLIKDRLAGKDVKPFAYVDRGSMAIVGQNEAVADMKLMNQTLNLKGPFAWLVWLLAHIYYLIEFDSKAIVTIQWVWNFFTRKRGARLITEAGSQSQMTVQVPETRESALQEA